jgi:ATP-dependent helicase HrpA
VGMKALDGDHYHGPRGLQFVVWPGSGLKKNRPKWIMAGELQETTRIFARNVARVEPDWIEKAGAHLVERSYVEPHWDKARGEVIAYENVSLFGLVLVARRKVSYGRIDPVRAREVFIEGALVAGELDTKLPFWAHNRQLIREIEELEHRTRRPDVLVDDAVIATFYSERLPPEVRDVRSLESWHGKDSKALFLTRADLMRHGAESVTEELFPRQLRMGETTFPLSYRFDPGHALDGVTVNVPLALLNQVDEATLDWLVPGMIRDKVAWTMKALPKRVRTQLIPVPEHVTKFLEWATPGERTVKDAVLAYAGRVMGDRLDADIWSKDDIPPHLLMNIRVVDDAKRELAMGRDLGELRKRLGEAASLTLAKSRPGMEREGITAWDFGELPAQVAFRRGNQAMTGYPALQDDGETASIRLFDTPDRAAAAHRGGVKRLMALAMKEQLRQLERGLSGFNPLALKFQATIPADKLKADVLEAIVDRAFIGDDLPPRDERGFEEQKKRAKARLPAVSEGALRYLAAIVEASQEYGAAIVEYRALGRVVQDVKAARERLVYPGFFARTPWEKLADLPRYLRGYAKRLEKYRGGADRDERHAHTVHTLWQNYEARLKADAEAGRRDPKLEDYRWLLEELRVSLFAQELRTPFPVSAKRLQKFWDEHLR